MCFYFIIKSNFLNWKNVIRLCIFLNWHGDFLNSIELSHYTTFKYYLLSKLRLILFKKISPPQFAYSLRLIFISDTTPMKNTNTKTKTKTKAHTCVLKERLRWYSASIKSYSMHKLITRNQDQWQRHYHLYHIAFGCRIGGNSVKRSRVIGNCK